MLKSKSSNSVIAKLRERNLSDRTGSEKPRTEVTLTEREKKAKEKEKANGFKSDETDNEKEKPNDVLNEHLSSDEKAAPNQKEVLSDKEDGEDKDKEKKEQKDKEGKKSRETKSRKTEI